VDDGLDELFGLGAEVGGFLRHRRPRAGRWHVRVMPVVERPPSLPHDVGRTISGRGHLAFVSTDGATHVVTVRIGAH
jgi:hypothetical protein